MKLSPSIKALLGCLARYTSAQTIPFESKSQIITPKNWVDLRTPCMLITPKKATYPNDWQRRELQGGEMAPWW